MEYFSRLKGKSCQPRILYLVKMLFRNRCEIKTSQGKEQLDTDYLKFIWKNGQGIFEKAKFGGACFTREQNPP